MNAKDKQDLTKLDDKFDKFLEAWNNKRESDAKFHGVVETQIGTLKDEQDKLRNRSNVFDGVIALGTLALVWLQSKFKL